MIFSEFAPSFRVANTGTISKDGGLRGRPLARLLFGSLVGVTPLEGKDVRLLPALCLLEDFAAGLTSSLLSPLE